MSKNSARIWPYSIGASIILVFGFCVATVIVTSSANIQETDAYMTNYQDAETRANDFINNRIAFDKKYKINYKASEISEDNSVLKYELTDIKSNIVSNAKLTIFVSRPETHEFDQTSDKFKFSDGIYTFSDIKFKKQGVWDIITKVEIGDFSRFYNIRVDTRNILFTVK